MRYISTRGQAPDRDFQGVLLAGLAEDGGLYVPQSFPIFSPADWRAMRGLSYADLAARVMQPFVGEALPADVLKTLCHQAYAGFTHPAVVPLVQFTSDRTKMGEFVNARWLTVLAWTTAVVIAGLNAWLLISAVLPAKS